MNTSDAIREMCRSCNKGTTEVSISIGRSGSYVGNMLSRGSTPRADTLALIAEACGYRLILEGNGHRIQIGSD